MGMGSLLTQLNMNTRIKSKSNDNGSNSSKLQDQLNPHLACCRCVNTFSMHVYSGCHMRSTCRPVSVGAALCLPTSWLPAPALFPWG